MHPDVEALRKACALGIDGVSLLGISKAAEEIGFNTIGGRLTLDSLITEAKLPCILHWKQNHFVVLYKVRRKKHHPIFYVADPGKGLLEYSERELQAYWISTQSQGEEKGIALLLEPTSLFHTLVAAQKIDRWTMKGATPSRLSFLWGYLKKYHRYFFQLMLGLFLASLLQLIFPFLTQSIVDTGIGGKEMASRLALTARASEERPFCRLVRLFHWALSTKIFVEPRLLIAPARKIRSMTGDLPSLFS